MQKVQIPPRVSAIGYWWEDRLLADSEKLDRAVYGYHTDICPVTLRVRRALGSNKRQLDRALATSLIIRNIVPKVELITYQRYLDQIYILLYIRIPPSPDHTAIRRALQLCAPSIGISTELSTRESSLIGPLDTNATSTEIGIASTRSGLKRNPKMRVVSATTIKRDAYGPFKSMATAPPIYEADNTKFFYVPLTRLENCVAWKIYKGKLTVLPITPTIIKRHGKTVVATVLADPHYLR